MRCDRAQELFSDYYEAALQPAMGLSLESHLKQCADCRAKMQDMKKVWRILDAPRPTLEPPAGLRGTIWRRLDADELKIRQARRPWYAFDWHLLFTRQLLVRAAAVLLVVALSGVYIPMRFQAARMIFPWSRFYSAARETLIVGNIETRLRPGGTDVLLPINNKGAETVTVHVRVESGPTRIAGSTYDISTSPGHDQNDVLFTYKPQTGDEPIRLRVEWNQNGQIQSKISSVPVN